MDLVDAFVVEIFTKISHHRNLLAVYICQNLFDKSKYHQTISLNSHYIVLLQNPRNTQPITNLARQIFASDWCVATDAYREATREQYCYLLFDLHLSTKDRLRLWTNIFPGKQSYSYIKELNVWTIIWRLDVVKFATRRTVSVEFDLTTSGTQEKGGGRGTFVDDRLRFASVFRRNRADYSADNHCQNAKRLEYMSPTQRLWQHIPLLQHLSKLLERDKKRFIKTADKSLVDSICECCMNILNGCTPLSSSQKTRLQHNKLDLRHLIFRKTVIGKKRKILQKGSFLSAILSAVILVVDSLIVSTISRSRRRRR